MAIALVVLLFFGVCALVLIRGVANEIDRIAEIEDAQLRINWPVARGIPTTRAPARNPAVGLDDVARGLGRSASPEVTESVAA